MRSPRIWIVFWLAATFALVLTWDSMRPWISGFWLGWSMAIFGQDIADWLKNRGNVKP